MPSQVTDFDPFSDIPPDFVLIMYGKRRAGKNTMMMYMLESMKERFKHHQTHVFCGTAEANPEQWKFFPPADVYGDLSLMDNKIGELLEDQLKSIRKEIKIQIKEKNAVGSVQNDKMQAFTAQTKEMDHPTKKRRIESSRKGNQKFIDEGSRSSRHANVRRNKHGRLKEKRNLMNRTINETFDHDNADATSPGKGDNEEDVKVTDEMIDEVLRSGDFDKSRMPRKLVILDDVVHDNIVRRSPELNRLAVSGRHWFFSVIILSQCVCGSASVPPIIRHNSDYIMIVYNPRQKQERKLLLEQYLTPASASEKDGLQLMSDITRVPFRALVVDVTNSVATQYAEFVYSYGPVPPPPDNVSDSFRLGTDEQWQKRLPGQRDAKFTHEDIPKPRVMKRGNIHGLDGGRFIDVKRTNFGEGASANFFDTIF